MIVVTGIGWVADKEYGSVMRTLRRDHTGTKSLYVKLQHESILVGSIKNFGRFDEVSKITCCSCALALHDAGIRYSEGRKRDIGIIGTNTVGCLKSNLRYFRDYVRGGRKMARGNLFVYTLASSPLAEGAILFGLQGPLLYVMFQHEQIPSVLRCAGEMIRRGEAAAMLAVKADGVESVCFVVRREEAFGAGKALDMEEVIAAAGEISCLDKMIQRFEKLGTYGSA